LINRGLLALDIDEPLEAMDCFEASLRVRGAKEYHPANITSIAGIGLVHLMSGRLSEARRIRELLPVRPRHWTFDPFLWISFETRLSALTDRSEGVTVELEQEERKLRGAIALAWVRLRLLRFELLFRWKQVPPEEDVRELAHFLSVTNLAVREADLGRLLSRFRYRM
jgi:hypothetical protein